MPITDKDKMQCMMAYPNAPIIADGEKYKSVAFNHLGNRIYLQKNMNDNTIAVHVNKCSVLLRPISSLTNEECIEVARVNGYVDNGVMQREYLINKGRYLSINSCLAVTIDYLRSINIITTVHSIDLVKEGIAIVDETKTTKP